MDQILYMDNNVNSCALFQQICHYQSIQLDIASNLEEAKLKIQNHLYLFYILAEFQPDAINLISLIQQKAPNHPITFILKNTHQSGLSYQILKEDFHIAYVLEEPLRSLEITALLNKLTGVAKPIETNKIMEKIPTNLKQAYNQSIYTKLTRLETLIKQILYEPNQKVLLDLKQDIHKISGSAASYGYIKVSHLCHLWENLLIEHIQSFQTGNLDKQSLFDHQQFLRNLKLYFQHIYP